MQNTQTQPAGESTPELDDPDSLPEKQEQALLALLAHPTHKEAALAAGVSEATLWRYRRDARFARRLRETRREVFSHAVQRLQHATGDAAKALHDLVKNPEESGGVRISAAREILNQSRRALENDDLKARIDELEQFILRKQEQDALDRAEREGEQ